VFGTVKLDPKKGGEIKGPETQLKAQRLGKGANSPNKEDWPSKLNKEHILKEDQANNPRKGLKTEQGLE